MFKRVPDEGSPPPMRGKADRGVKIFNNLGITPAYAGKSFAAAFHVGCNQDHPRLCGEKLHAAHRTWLVLGSPPPMRGKVAVLIVLFASLRITPAYAGKRSLGFTVYLQHSGSPPPMRGKVIWDVEYYECGGITPAYAGKSLWF